MIITVQKGNILASRRRHSNVSGGACTLIDRQPDDLHGNRKFDLGQPLDRTISGAIIYNNDLNWPVLLFEHTFESPEDIIAPVVGWDDDADQSVHLSPLTITH